jgi:hypothetical protein
MQMQTQTPRMSTTYWILRGIVIAFAGGSLLLLTIGFLIGDSYLESAPAGTLELAFMIGGVAVIISYLIPNRWAVTTAFFHLRFVAQVIAVARILYMSMLLVSGAYGPKHFLIYPVLGVMLFVSSAAPVLLVIRRRAHMKARQNNEPSNVRAVA